MDDQELLDLLKDIESDRVERKASLSDPSRIRQAICAFANDLPNHQKPGVVFVGANHDGTCANLAVTDKLLLDLANMRSDGNILPLPAMTVQKRTLDGCELAVVIVQPSYAPPVFCRGRVWVRVGPRRAIASAGEVRRLSEKRRAQDLPFDLWPVHSATLADLNLELFRRLYLPSALAPETIEQNQRPVEAQLASLRFITIDPDPKPTVLGILATGKDPTGFVPGAYVQFLRIDGSELTDPIKDQKAINGPLPDLLRTLDEIFEVHISVALDIAPGSVDVRHPDYPIVALQQLARNAVLHRTYEGTNAPVRMTWFNDRIEIQSPGGPYGQVSRENFGRPGIIDYRNPHLAEAMKNLGYIQRFGMGIPLAHREMKKNGNPPPEFVVEGNHILVVLRRQA